MLYFSRGEVRKIGIQITSRAKQDFVIDEADYRITARDGLEFALDAAVTLGQDGTGTGPVTASEVGAAYNVAAGALTRMYVNLAGVTGWQSGAAAGGADAESSEALFARLSARLQTPATSGNAYQYRQWALAVPGVGDARVLPLWNGAGTVKVLLAGDDLGPVDGAVVSAAAAYIEEERPIGADVTVRSAEALTVDVAAAVTIDGTTTRDEVRAALVSNLDTYLQGLAFQAETVVYSQVLYRLLAIPGVTDYTSLTLNGGTGNLTIGAEQVPVPGTVTVT